MPSARCSASSTCICSARAAISSWPSALGANVVTIDGVHGVRFAVWAPNAERVAVVGDFNTWDAPAPSDAPAPPPASGSCSCRGVGAGRALQVRHRRPGRRARAAKGRSGGASRPRPPGHRLRRRRAEPFRWPTTPGCRPRRSGRRRDAPISIYEVHLGSWLAPGDGDAASLWDSPIERLVPYVAEMGFTHVELLPITEHPFGGSWGYQPLGLFAPTARFGPPEASRASSTRCTRPASACILDWVPAHFPTDAHGLARFDGTALYEHHDPREGFHQDWNTLIYNFGRREVQGFLIASALHWLEHFHVDGLRVDAVASMLYRDYSRQAGEWIPNVHGGRENLEAVGFLRHLNAVVRRALPRRHRRWPRNRPPGRGVTRPLDAAGSASPTNGTWAGCTTRCVTWSTTRSIAPTTTTT